MITHAQHARLDLLEALYAAGAWFDDASPTASASTRARSASGTPRVRRRPRSSTFAGRRDVWERTEAT